MIRSFHLFDKSNYLLAIIYYMIVFVKEILVVLESDSVLLLNCPGYEAFPGQVRQHPDVQLAEPYLEPCLWHKLLASTPPHLLFLLTISPHFLPVAANTLT